MYNPRSGVFRLMNVESVVEPVLDIRRNAIMVGLLAFVVVVTTSSWMVLCDGAVMAVKKPVATL